MPKNWIFALFLTIFAIGLIGVPQAVSAQDKPTPDVKEKAKECDDDDDDDDDDEDITAADRALVKVTLADARKIALQKVPGKITDQELEKEHGRLQYAFEIVTADGKEFDVEIDAITGEILKVEDDDDDGDEVDEAKGKVVKKVTVVKTAKLVKTKPQ